MQITEDGMNENAKAYHHHQQQQNQHQTIYEVTPPSPNSLDPSQLIATPSAGSVHDGSDTLSIMTEYVGSGNMNRMDLSGVGMGGHRMGFPTGEDAMLAPMRAITSNPTFWYVHFNYFLELVANDYLLFRDDMMLPGFSWAPMETNNQVQVPDFFQQFTATAS